MEVQSLSVCVPGGCPNNCKFCVSQMHPSPYIDQIEKNTRFRDLYERDYMRRLQFARDNGCNTVILTGDGEPLMNDRFLKDFAHWNGTIQSPFRWVEIQTSGVTLDDEKLRFLRRGTQADPHRPRHKNPREEIMKTARTYENSVVSAPGIGDSDTPPAKKIDTGKIALAFFPLTPVSFTGPDMIYAIARVAGYSALAYFTYNKMRKVSYAFMGAAGVSLATSLTAGMWGKKNA